MKVLFLLQGLEKDRTIGAIISLKPDRVIVVRNDPETGYELPEVEKTVQNLLTQVRRMVNRRMRLEAPAMDFRTHKVPFFDFYASYFAFDKWIGGQRRQKAEIFVDITGGTRLVTAALTLAAMVHKARILYVSPQEYNISRDDPQIGRGFREIKWIGTLPVKVSPKSIRIGYLAALKRLGGKTPSIKALAVEATGHELFHGDAVAASSVVRDLRSMGLVEIDTAGGRERPVKLTNTGESFLAAAEASGIAKTKLGARRS